MTKPPSPGGGVTATATLTAPGDARPGADAGPGPTDSPVPDMRWLMASDVCKHCTHAACLDVCPTGSLFRTEFGTVVVQDDVCNGCGYCVAACPFGVIERRRGDEGHEKGGQSHGISIKGGASSSGHANPQSHASSNGEVKNVGIAQKCTLCYDRLGAGQTPACAQACPTTSIKFGDLAEMRSTARARVAELHELGFTEARLYGSDENDGVGGTGSVFLLLDEPEVYGLPPDPRVTTADLPDMFRKAGFAGAGDARHGSRGVRGEATVTTNPLDADRPPEPERRRDPASHGNARDRAGQNGGRRRRDESLMVPDVRFDSYYGRHIVKPAPWEKEIAAYLFLGGVAAGSSLLAAGGAALGYPALRRAGRIGAVGAAALGGAALAKDLGKPSRALNMMRTVKLTSPMSVGSWILTAFSAFSGAGPRLRAGSWADRVPAGWPGSGHGARACLAGPRPRRRPGHRGFRLLRPAARRLHGRAPRRHGDTDVARVLP